MCLVTLDLCSELNLFYPAVAVDPKVTKGSYHLLCSGQTLTFGTCWLVGNQKANIGCWLFS